jgi:hypothetical protein
MMSKYPANDCSSRKSNGQNGNDENNGGSPDKDCNAVHDECQHGVFLVKAYNSFHRLCFSNSKLALVFWAEKQNEKNHLKSPSSTWESCEGSDENFQ